MAEWVEKGSLKGPPGEIPDVSDFLRDGDVSSAISGSYDKVASDKAVKDYVDSVNSELDGKISAETTSRQEQDEVLLGQISEKANVEHSHEINDVTGLRDEIDGKSAISHTHVSSDVTDLQGKLDAKSNTGHTHEIANVTGLQTALDGKAASKHSHEMSDITGLDSKISEIEGDVAGKADSAHTHDAADVVSGTLVVDRIPSIPDSKIENVSASKLVGTIPTGNLPSYVDDVIEADDYDSLPPAGEAGKIYVDKETNKTYRWGGSAYVEISASLALGDTSATAFRGDYGKVAYDHAQAKGSEFATGFYKITTNAEGHVTSATAVTKGDITALGVPAQDTDTTYTAGSGLSLSGTEFGIADGGVIGRHLDDNCVMERNIAVGSVTSDKIPALAITTPKLVDNAVTAIKMADDAVATRSIQDGAVTAEKIAEGVIPEIPDVSLTALGVTATAEELNYMDGASSNVQSQLDSKANMTHTHVASDVSGLQDALDSKASLVHTHSTSDVTGLDGALAGKSDNGHKHVSADVTDLNGKLDAKANVTHTHAIDDVTNLKTTLDGKAATVHSHDMDDVDGLQEALDDKANVDDVSLAALGVTVSAAEINYVDGVTSSVQSQLNGKAAATHTHTQDDVDGLATALSGKANATHTHTIANVTGLQGALDDKIDVGSVSLGSLGITATAAELNYMDGVTSNVQTQLNGKANSSHTHSIENVSGLQTALDAKAASSHTHSAANVTSGTFDIARIPSIPDSKITGISASKITGTIPAGNLPSYVDDVLEYDSQSVFPEEGEAGKIYIDKATNKTYRWSGSSYAEISASLALGTTSSTAFRGDYGNVAYQHAQAKGSAFASGLYKITTNAHGHVTAATAVNKTDITALGIPGTNTTYSNATTSSSGLMSSTDKLKLDGIASGANKYTHPASAAGAKSSGLYKITTDANGHITAATAVTKTDITDLGIPAQDTNTTYSNMKGASTSAAGTAGLVPAPSTGEANRYLRSDGTWSVPPDTNTTYTLSSFGITATAAELNKLDGVTATAAELNYVDGVTSNIQTQLNGKAASSHTHQYAGSASAGGSANSAVKLDTSAGSATQPVYFSGGKPVATTYSLGASVPSGAKFTDTTYSTMKGATSSAAGSMGLVPAPAAGKQTSFLRGDGTWVVPTNTTYSNMSGASSSAAGKAGLVPAPSAGAANRYLRSDGTWAVPPDTNTTYTLSSFGITATAAELNKLDGVTATAAELNYVDGVTSNIQTQLNGKAASSHTHAVSQITGLTASRALVSDASGHPAVSTVTSTELGYLDGVTSAIQTQLNGKAASSHTHSAATTSANGFMSSADKVKLNGIEAGATQNDDIIIKTESPLNNEVSVAVGRQTNTISIEPSEIDNRILATIGGDVAWEDPLMTLASTGGSDGQVLTISDGFPEWAESGAKVHRIYSDSDTWMDFDVMAAGNDNGLSGKIIPLSDFGSVTPQKGDLVVANRDDILRYVYSVSSSDVKVITIIPKELPSVLPISKGGTGVTSEDALVQKIFNSASTPKASATQYGVVKFASDADFKAYMGIS